MDAYFDTPTFQSGLLFIFVFPLGIHRKPALQYPLALVKHFLDGPKGREGENAQQGREQDAFYQQGTDDAQDAQQKEYPPTAGAPIIFGLNHHGMKQPDDKESTDADDDSFQCLFFYSLQMGISFLMLCSREMRVSVAVTPGIS